MAEPVTGGNDYDLHRQLAILDGATPLSHSLSNSDSSSITPFSLPHDWIIHRVPRSDGPRVDTMQDFENNQDNGYQFKNVTHRSFVSTGRRFQPPDGWTVKEVPRKTGDHIDRYYYEPGTGRMFRSSTSVKKHLEAQLEENLPLSVVLEELKQDNLPLSKPFKLATSIKMTPESNGITKSFTLPEDWFVETVPRKSVEGSDKYYHDPETGRKFRSLKDVERYLTGRFIPSSRSNSKRPKYNEKFQDFEKDQYNASTFNLPDGWTVKEVPRKTGDHIDKYFYEPGTGRKFKSLTSVQKHLAQLEDNSPLSVAVEELKQDKLPLSKNHGSYDSWKKSISNKEQDSSFSNAPPNKINWVDPGSAGESWNAFVGGELVPDSTKLQWGRRFMMTINHARRNEQE